MPQKLTVMFTLKGFNTSKKVATGATVATTSTKGSNKTTAKTATVKTANNATKNTVKMEKTNKNVTSMVIASNLSGLELLAALDVRFRTVDFKQSEPDIKADFISILANAKAANMVAEPPVATPKAKATPKTKATPKATPKAKATPKKPSKLDLGREYIAEVSSEKDEEERWFTNQHLVMHVTEILGEETEAANVKTLSTLIGKMKKEGYEFEDSMEIFENDKGHAVKAFRIVAN